MPDRHSFPTETKRAVSHPRRTASLRPALRTAAQSLGLLLALALAPPPAAAQAAKITAQPVQGGTLNVALGTDTAIIDPSITGSSITAVIARNLVDSLVGQAEDNSFTPWLAERWEISDDYTRYTFHLRKDVTFSDGTRLDAEAVKYNFDRIIDPKTTSAYAKSLLGPVKSIEASDADTVVIQYQKPFSPLLQGLSLPYLGIQSPTYLKKTANTKNTVVGSGPFTLESFVKGSGSHLTKRQDYNWGPGYAAHNGAAYLDAIVFKILPEASVRLGALTSGQVDAIDNVPPANYRSVKENPSLQVVTRENPGVNTSYFLNTSRGPFADEKVRQAFQGAVDAKSAVQVAYLGSLKPADNIFGPSTLYYDPSIAAAWGYDPSRANKLLDEAGWSQRDGEGFRTKDGKRLTVRYVYDSSDKSAEEVLLAQAVQFQVKQVGFELELVPTDDGGHTAALASNDYDIDSFWYVRAEPDILRTVFLSDYIPPKGANSARVTALDERLLKAVGASDEERKQLYGEAQKEIIEKAYAVPLFVAAYQLGASKKLQGVSWATNAKPNFYDAWLER
ncbi:dipeptide/oligopeptide ABC transporter substrate-binding protein (plasmid) [Rhizobium gallicum]|uniref:Dipeptide/oligopeptide ABC transporter substrate-binding protein n=1 Tax=Rhizobium gallicum TaxID=56730 RepID=A0A1L5NRB8_9HYPH|nr:ABC transporter substrate-binding protein [Rhizobium gallicum]APO70453.1 dipeptide/oligopeptide ABC transporter substrate-binding protein [Rhizobium gallicum]